MVKLVLGSQSKWRQSIAKESLGMEVELSAADIDEKLVAKQLKEDTPSNHVEAIATSKLNTVLQRFEEPTIVMCYDTVVVFNNEILEKPLDREDLIRMVKEWSQINKKTQVYTAVAIGRNDTNEKLVTVCKSEMTMIRSLTDEEFQTYINDKYVSCSSGALIVENILDIKACEINEGSIDVIQGFPIEVTKQFVNKLLRK